MRSAVAIKHTGTTLISESTGSARVPVIHFELCRNPQHPPGPHAPRKRETQFVSASAEIIRDGVGKTGAVGLTGVEHYAVVRIWIVLGHSGENACAAKHERANMGRRLRKQGQQQLIAHSASAQLVLDINRNLS